MISLRRLLFPSVLTAALTTTIFLLVQDIVLSGKIFLNTPITLMIPLVTSVIGIFAYFRLIHRNELNMGRIECMAFGLFAAILWTFLIEGLGSIVFPSPSFGWPTYGWNTWILPVFAYGFFLCTGGAFFCAFVLPPIGLSPGKLAPSPRSDVALVRRRKILSLAVIAVISVFVISIFPTTHIRSVNLNQPFPFEYEYMGMHIPTFLFGSQSVERDFYASRPQYLAPYLSATTFTTVVDVQSTEDVSISVVITEEHYSSSAGKPVVSQVHVCYSETAKVHNYTFQQAITGDDPNIHYVVTARNPSPVPPNGIPTLDWQAFLENGTITFYYPDGTVLVPLYMSGSINVNYSYQYTEWRAWWSP